MLVKIYADDTVEIGQTVAQGCTTGRVDVETGERDCRLPPRFRVLAQRHPVVLAQIASR